MNTVNDFKPGDRIQTHPATSAWMRGQRFGTVVRTGKHTVIVELDRGARQETPFHPDNLIHID